MIIFFQFWAVVPVIATRLYYSVASSDQYFERDNFTSSGVNAMELMAMEPLILAEYAMEHEQKN